MTKKPAGKDLPMVVTSRRASDPDVQIQVWDAYAAERSVLGAAQVSGFDVDLVRKVIYMDTGRLKTMLKESMESIVARYEHQHDRAQQYLDRLMAQVGRWITEIEEAAAAGRATAIAHPSTGLPMQPTEAFEFVLMSKAMDTLMRMRDGALKVSRDFRFPDPVRSAVEAAGEGGEASPFAVNIEDMDEVQLIRFIRRGGYDVPPALAEKVKQVEKQAG